MAPHSSTLAWKIPWMEEPGGLQSTGSHPGYLPNPGIELRSPSLQAGSLPSELPGKRKSCPTLCDPVDCSLPGSSVHGISQACTHRPSLLPIGWFSQILNDDTVRSAVLNTPANLENSAVATRLQKVSFHSNPKERQCQRMLKLPHNCIQRPAGFPSSDKTRPDSPVPTLQGLCDPIQIQRIRSEERILLKPGLENFEHSFASM